MKSIHEFLVSDERIKISEKLRSQESLTDEETSLLESLGIIVLQSVMVFCGAEDSEMSKYVKNLKLVFSETPRFEQLVGAESFLENGGYGVCSILAKSIGLDLAVGTIIPKRHAAVVKINQKLNNVAFDYFESFDSNLSGKWSTLVHQMPFSELTAAVTLEQLKDFDRITLINVSNIGNTEDFKKSVDILHSHGFELDLSSSHYFVYVYGRKPN